MLSNGEVNCPIYSCKFHLNAQMCHCIVKQQVKPTLPAQTDNSEFTYALITLYSFPLGLYLFILHTPKYEYYMTQFNVIIYNAILT